MIATVESRGSHAEAECTDSELRSHRGADAALRVPMDCNRDRGNGPDYKAGVSASSSIGSASRVLADRDRITTRAIAVWRRQHSIPRANASASSCQSGTSTSSSGSNTMPC